jgi:hypothetical protein
VAAKNFFITSFNNHVVAKKCLHLFSSFANFLLNGPLLSLLPAIAFHLLFNFSNLIPRFVLSRGREGWGVPLL